MTTPTATPQPANKPADEHILVVDDEPGVRTVLARGLWDAGYQCVMAADGEEALARLRRHPFALMLSDIRMPKLDGLELLPLALKAQPDLTVIMITALAGLQTALSAIRAGAYDYITKPFQIAEVELVVQRALEHRRLRLEHRAYTTRLEELVEERTQQLRDANINFITSMALALEAKDEWTHDHSRRVAELAAAIGRQMGLNERACFDLRLAGMLHDLGKLGVREAVLHKPDSLTPAEFRHVMQHPELGARILSPLRELSHIIPMVRHHHERWDGKGYPSGLAGEAIPDGARILGVADAYVAMREDRPYRRGMKKEQALNEIRLGARRQFDLHVVSALLALDEAKLLATLDETFPQDLAQPGAA